VTVRVALAPAAVVNVRVAVRWLGDWFTVAYTYTSLLPTPEVGVMVSQDASEVVAVHTDVVTTFM